jgi:hypothetical protein
MSPSVHTPRKARQKRVDKLTRVEIDLRDQQHILRSIDYPVGPCPTPTNKNAYTIPYNDNVVLQQEYVLGQ